MGTELYVLFVGQISVRLSTTQNTSTTAPTAEQKWNEGERMNENKYYLKVDNRTVAECIPLEYALIFIKSIFENYYNDHEIVISIAEMERCEVCEVSE